MEQTYKSESNPPVASLRQGLVVRFVKCPTKIFLKDNLLGERGLGDSVVLLFAMKGPIVQRLTNTLEYIDLQDELDDVAGSSINVRGVKGEQTGSTNNNLMHCSFESSRCGLRRSSI